MSNKVNLRHIPEPSILLDHRNLVIPSVFDRKNVFNFSFAAMWMLSMLLILKKPELIEFMFISKEQVDSFGFLHGIWNIFAMILGFLILPIIIAALGMVVARVLEKKLKFMKYKKCHNCGSSNLEHLDGAVINESYEHQTKDEKKDKRFSGNMKAGQYMSYKKCIKCKNINRFIHWISYAPSAKDPIYHHESLGEE